MPRAPPPPPRGKARAAREVAAVGVVALVRQGREERVHQVAVRIVDLEDLEAGLQRALGRVHPVALERHEIGDGKLPRHDEALGHRLRGRRDDVPGLLAARQVLRASARRCRTRAAAWSPCGPACAIWMPGTTLCAFMNAAMRFERRDVRGRPDSQVAVGDAALVRHRGGLDEHASPRRQAPAGPSARSGSPGRCRPPPNRWPSGR